MIVSNFKFICSVFHLLFSSGVGVGERVDAGDDIDRAVQRNLPPVEVTPLADPVPRVQDDSARLDPLARRNDADGHPHSTHTPRAR